MLSEKLKKVTGLYDEWWKGTNTNAVISCTYFDYAAYKSKFEKRQKKWMEGRDSWLFARALEKSISTSDTVFIEDALDVIEAFFECEGYAGAGFPGFFTNLGAGCIAAFISGYAKPYVDTVWFELDRPMDWENIFSCDRAGMNTYGKMALEAVKLVGKRLKDVALPSMFDLGGAVDVLASLRRSDTLLYDVIDNMDKAGKSLEPIQSVWKAVHDDTLKILEEYNYGHYTSWMQLLSTNVYYPSQCDFSAMISPFTFEELVLPSLIKEMSWYDKGVYHLDGPGELPHVDLLCTIKNLYAVQWVPMPYQPHHLEMHYPLYKKLIENGKKIILDGFINDGEQVKKLFSVFPKEAFFLTIVTGSREEAEKIASLK